MQVCVTKIWQEEHSLWEKETDNRIKTIELSNYKLEHFGWVPCFRSYRTVQLQLRVVSQEEGPQLEKKKTCYRTQTMED